MSAGRPPADDTRRIDREAAAWLVRRDRGLTAAEQDAYCHWLAADPRHGAWLARHRRTWAEFNLLAEWKPEHSREPNPDLLARPPRAPAPFRRWLGVAALAAAAVVAMGALLWLRPAVRPAGAPPSAPRMLAADRYQRETLADGSVVELRAGAQVEVAYAAAERRVRLVRGEAAFTVAKNPARPFVVRVAGIDVRAVGTAFNIRLGEQQVQVLVTEGRVRVDDALRGGSVLAAAAGETPLLHAGQMLTVGLVPAAAPAPVAAISSDEVTRLLAGRPDLLEFDSTPLAAVAEAFNRRNAVRLVVDDPALRDLPIVASFRADNVDGFLRLLELTAGVRLERRGDTVLIRRGR